MPAGLWIDFRNDVWRKYLAKRVRTFVKDLVLVLEAKSAGRLLKHGASLHLTRDQGCLPNSA